MNQTNIFQETIQYDEGETIYYYILQSRNKEKIRIACIGSLELPQRRWVPTYIQGESCSGIFTLSWWKTKRPLPGEGRLESGRVIKNRIPPSHYGLPRGQFRYHSLVECNLPPEYYPLE